MNKLSVMTILGTRPELIRLSMIIKKLDQFCDHVLVHTGQSYDYELNGVFFDDLGIRKPDIFLNAAEGSVSAAQTIGNIIARSDTAIVNSKPDAILILGDTNSSLAAIAAKRRKVPIFHMEAGNRSFDLRVPEEINRKIVDHISDINLTYSSIAREYLMREGLPPDQVINIGSPMLEVLNYHKTEIDQSKILSKLSLKEKEYFVVSAHREENIDDQSNFKSFCEVLNLIARRYQLPIIVSTHPRTFNKISEAAVTFDPLIRFEKPLGFYDYIKLQANAKTVLSDSGTITEESSILNFPALNLRQAHERPEGMEEASVMLVGMNENLITCGLEILKDQPRGEERLIRVVQDYDVENVSEKVLRIIHSYSDYVQRVVWRNY